MYVCIARLVKHGTGAMPVVPLAQIMAGKENLRPARGERASVEAEQAVADQVRVALDQLAHLDDSGDGVALAELLGQHIRQMQAEIGALKKDKVDDAKKLEKFAAAAKVHEAAARQKLQEEAAAAKERAQLERRVQLLERESRSAPLTYNRFTQNPESVLARNMGPFLFIDTVPALKAHVAKLNAFYPLELLRWVDTNAKDPSLPPEEAEDAENAESEGEGDSQRAVKRRNRCPMKRPEDAVVLWLFILRTGSTFEQTGAMFDVSRMTVRRVFYTMRL